MFKRECGHLNSIINRQIEPQYYYQDVKSNEKTQWVEKNYKLVSFIWDLEKPSQFH